MILAVDEVCANLIIHANHCDEGSHLHLTMETKPEEVEFIIKDKGVGFNINEYREPDISEIVNAKRKGGLGLMLVKRIMDQIEFSTEKNHNICKLVKKLSSFEIFNLSIFGSLSANLSLSILYSR